MEKLDIDTLSAECPWEEWQRRIRHGRTEDTGISAGWRVFYSPAVSRQDEAFDWFKDRGWLLDYEQGKVPIPNTLIVSLMPIKYVEPPAVCYHTTLLKLLPKIFERGLCRGRDCEQATSSRRSSGHNIYVSFTLTDARQWMKSSLLGDKNEIDAWAIVKVDLAGVGCKVFRDPKCVGRTGYILDTRCVPSRFLRHIETLPNMATPK